MKKIWLIALVALCALGLVACCTTTETYTSTVDGKTVTTTTETVNGVSNTTTTVTEAEPAETVIETYADLVADGQEHEFEFELENHLLKEISAVYFFPEGESYEDKTNLLEAMGLDLWTPADDSILLSGTASPDLLKYNIVIMDGEQPIMLDVDLNRCPATISKIALEQQEDGIHVMSAN